ncbi:hypothetical protein BBJ28_00004195 [Nothophytophthora sp. Chile5]|nr:hypothetical protein BBJ28_00004195 [Nothophytophthora sp. Chile5]
MPGTVLLDMILKRLKQDTDQLAHLTCNHSDTLVLVCCHKHKLIERTEMEFLRNLSERHEALKKRIHSTRIPLSKNGQRAMGVVYFVTPIVAGYYIMKWTERRAEANFQREVSPSLRSLSLSLCMHTRESGADVMEAKLRQLFEVRSGYRDEHSQAALLAKHFRTFDRDGSGVLDFDEFARAMLSLNFVGVQAETEALFDRYDEDLDGVLSYAEFARAVTGCADRALLSGRARSLLERVREGILAAGGKNGIRTLGVLLRRMDQNGNGGIELEVGLPPLPRTDWEILQLGVRDADPEELERTFQCFDKDQSGKITVDELMRGLRGSMPKRRILLVKQAFSRLDTSGDGKATLEEVERLYDASHHPQVLAGRMKPRDAMLELMSVFEQSDSRGDGVITWHEFLEYYKELSAGFASGDEFELMVRNAWHLSGGTGWSANSSCRRVLATFRDGSQRVLEIENDLGVAASDTRRMREMLAAQGHRDIVALSLAS